MGQGHSKRPVADACLAVQDRTIAFAQSRFRARHHQEPSPGSDAPLCLCWGCVDSEALFPVNSQITRPRHWIPCGSLYFAMRFPLLVGRHVRAKPERAGVPRRHSPHLWAQTFRRRAHRRDRKPRKLSPPPADPASGRRLRQLADKYGKGIPHADETTQPMPLG